MRWQDMTPLFAMLVLAICIGAIVYLAVVHIEVPVVIITLTGLAGAFLFASSNNRGTSPPADGGPK